jgi:cellulose synthase/poly-beta-1,6-N-acetylglucosamine synthase-like glycosyltransferase
VASKFGVVWAVQAAFDRALAPGGVRAGRTRSRNVGAAGVHARQIVVGFVFLTVVMGGLAFAPLATLIALNVAMGLFYLGSFIFKGILVSVGGGRAIEKDMSIEVAARALRDDELPVFTVLVPMFREPEMLPRLAQALRALEYPLGKLDIKIVLEAEDETTIQVAQTLGLEGVFEIIRVPPSQPQTKPKACNFALRFARGEYLVVYDAEDRPEPDQLRKVVEAFRRSSPVPPACAG